MHFKTIAGLIVIGALGTSAGISHGQENDTTPNVLIIGDSISIGYTGPLRGKLKGKANVYHNPGNGRDSATGLQNLDRWLGKTEWSVILFNHGLHDMIQGYRGADDKYVATNTGKALVPIDQYRENLEKIAQRLGKTNAKLFFAKHVKQAQVYYIQLKNLETLFMIFHRLF